MVINDLEIETASYHLDNDMLYMRIKENADISLEAAIEGVNTRRKLHGDKKVLLLVDMRLVGEVHRDARAYAAKKEVEEMNKAMALLTGKSLPAKIIANFFIKVNKPRVPTKLFKDEKKAVEWLKTFR